MPIITKFKLKQTVDKFKREILTEQYRVILANKLFFLSKNNREFIGLFALFLKDPVEFIKTHNLEWRDTLTFVFEKNPAYHSSEECAWLKSIFDNMLIPYKVKEHHLEYELRTVANAHEALFNSNRAEFISLCVDHFKATKPNLNLTTEDFKDVLKANSGVADYDNTSRREILKKLKELYHRIRLFFEDEDNATVARNLINRLSVRNKTEIPRPLGLPLEKVKKALDELYFFNQEFVRLATEFYIAVYNSKIEFDQYILEALQFKPCRACYHHSFDDDNLGPNPFEIVMPTTPTDTLGSRHDINLVEMDELLNLLELNF